MDGNGCTPMRGGWEGREATDGDVTGEIHGLEHLLLLVIAHFLPHSNHINKQALFCFFYLLHPFLVTRVT